MEEEKNEFKDRELKRLFSELYQLGFSIDNTALNEWMANKDNLRLTINWEN